MTWLGRSYVQDWLGYWGYVSDSATQRWAAALDQTRARKYGPKEWYGDVFGFWEDVSTAWWTALNGQRDRPATVVFTIGQKTEGGVNRIVPVFRPSLPRRDPRVIWMGMIERDPHGSGAVLEARSLDVGWASDGGGIEIALKGLYDPHDRPAQGLALGSYQALVHVGDVPIAMVFVHVIDENAPQRPGDAP